MSTSRRKKRSRRDNRPPRTAIGPARLDFDRIAVLVIAIGLALGVAGAWWAVSAALAADPNAGGGGHDHGTPVPSGGGPGAEPALIGGLGVVLAIFGLRRWLDERLMDPGGVAVLAASSLLFADGIVHLFAAARHVSHFSLILFFIASGVGLLAVGFLVLWERPGFVFLTTLGVGALIAIYFASRLFTLPLESQPEPFEALGVVSKVIEFAALVPLYVMFMADVSRDRSGEGAWAPSGRKQRPAPARSGNPRSGNRTPGSSVQGNPGAKGPRRSGTLPERSK